MAALVQIVETNGAAPGVDTPGVVHINFGSIDAPGLDPLTHPIKTGSQSYEKYLRLYIENLSGINKLDNIKVWISSLGGGYKADEIIKCNCTTDFHHYSSTLYESPVAEKSLKAVFDMPTSEPHGPNVGMDGLLSGAATTAPKYSDYIVLQLQTGAKTPAGELNQKIITFQWDEQ